MPLLHACSTCGTAHANKGRCPRCKTSHDKARNQRPKHTEIWNTAAWKADRAKAIQRDGACLACGHTGSKANPLTVHHSEGYADPRDVDALVTLCRSCHGRRHGGHNRV